MAIINVSAGSEAVLHLSATSAAEANVSANALVVPSMQDITINNSTGVFRFKTLDSTAEKAVTTPATNQISLNCVVDDTAFFGTASSGDDDAKEFGLIWDQQRQKPKYSLVHTLMEQIQDLNF